MQESEVRYAVRSEYDAAARKDFFWVVDARREFVRVGTVTVQRGRALKLAVHLEEDWQAAVERLGRERAELIYG